VIWIKDPEDGHAVRFPLSWAAAEPNIRAAKSAARPRLSRSDGRALGSPSHWLLSLAGITTGGQRRCTCTKGPHGNPTDSVLRDFRSVALALSIHATPPQSHYTRQVDPGQTAAAQPRAGGCAVPMISLPARQAHPLTRSPYWMQGPESGAPGSIRLERRGWWARQGRKTPLAHRKGTERAPRIRRTR
jgi:hypothetical protein